MRCNEEEGFGQITLQNENYKFTIRFCRATQPATPLWSIMFQLATEWEWTKTNKNHLLHCVWKNYCPLKMRQKHNTVSKAFWKYLEDRSYILVQTWTCYLLILYHRSSSIAEYDVGRLTHLAYTVCYALLWVRLWLHYVKERVARSLLTDKNAPLCLLHFLP